MGHIRVITAAKVVTLLTLCTATDGILGHFSHYFCLCKIRLPLKIIAENFMLSCPVQFLDYPLKYWCCAQFSGSMSVLMLIVGGAGLVGNTIAIIVLSRWGQHHHQRLMLQSYFQPGYQQLLQPNFDSYEYNGQVKEISIKFWIMDSKVYFLLFRGSSECSIFHSFITVHKKSVLQREYYYLHFHVDYE